MANGANAGMNSPRPPRSSSSRSSRIAPSHRPGPADGSLQAPGAGVYEPQGAQKYRGTRQGDGPFQRLDRLFVASQAAERQPPDPQTERVVGLQFQRLPRSEEHTSKDED